MDQEELHETLTFLDDWMDRYQYIIDLGKRLAPLSDDEKVDAHKVTGCLSQVWLVCDDSDDGKLHLRGDSDSTIVKGLIAVLFVLYDDKTLSQIQSVDLEEFFSEVGLQDHLSPNRRNGFFSMVQRVKSLAQGL
ncbi:MAG: SufE family protein [Deltaproteobacteria bacterium]|nr:SufE family protein [Deltaproteobacteria bacterium]